MNKENIKQFIYSSDIWDYYDSEEQMLNEYTSYQEDFWGENWAKDFDLDTPEQIRNAMITNNLSDNECFWSDFYQQIPDTNQILIKANCGRWDGRYNGGKVCENLKEAIDEIINFKGSYELKIYIDKESDTLEIELIHHDNTDYYTLYELTIEGVEYFNNEYDLTEEELHEKLLENEKYYNKISEYWL